MLLCTFTEVGELQEKNRARAKKQAEGKIHSWVYARVRSKKRNLFKHGDSIGNPRTYGAKKKGRTQGSGRPSCKTKKKALEANLNQIQRKGGTVMPSWRQSEVGPVPPPAQVKFVKVLHRKGRRD